MSELEVEHPAPPDNVARSLLVKQSGAKREREDARVRVKGGVRKRRRRERKRMVIRGRKEGE